jgi:hypothetical protein
MTSQLLRRGHELGLFIISAAALLSGPSGAAEPAVSARTESTARAPSAVIPGFDSVEHRFGFGAGYARATSVGVDGVIWRIDYTLAWRGWGVGAAFAFDLQNDDDGQDERITLGGLALRRSFLIGNGRLWGGLELGIVRLARGWRGEREVILYHGTSSAAELGFDLGRTTTLRPFVSIRVDFPWYTTEVERLTPAPDGGSDAGVVFIDYSREWTPVYGIWGGVAL